MGYNDILASSADNAAFDIHIDISRVFSVQLLEQYAYYNGQKYERSAGATVTPSMNIVRDRRPRFTVSVNDALPSNPCALRHTHRIPAAST